METVESQQSEAVITENYNSVFLKHKFDWK